MSSGRRLTRYDKDHPKPKEPAMTDDLVERVARVLASANGFDPDEICDNHTPTCPGPVWRLYQGTAKAAIAIALEDAAKVAEERVAYSTGQAVIRDSIAAAIRAMIKEKNDE
jgi:hypothetical protein